MNKGFAITRECKVLAALTLIVALASIAWANSRPQTLDGTSLGLSTPAGNEIWVDDPLFDKRWRMPAGSLACCWEEAGKTASMYGKPIPREVLVRWMQDAEDFAYEATVQLDEDLAEQMSKLPGYTVISSGRRDPGRPHLFIGMKPDGEVIVWLSNAWSERNVEGRVLHVVGRAQATAMSSDEYRRRIDIEEGRVPKETY